MNGISASKSGTVPLAASTERPEGGLGAAARRAWRRAQAAQRVALPLLVAVVVTVAWEYGTKLANISPDILVPPSAVWERLQESFPILLQQSVPTVTETLLGFLLASALGIVLGTALVLSKRVRQAIYPHILMFQLIPKVALAPLFIVWLGIGPASRLSFVVFMAFFPVVISTMTGLMSADRNILRLCASLTATPWQTFIAVRAPYALPHLFAGMKIAATMAIIGVIVGEFVTAQEGLGYIIMFASSADDTALVFAAIGLLCAIGLTLYGTVALIEALIQRRLGVAITSSEFF